MRRLAIALAIMLFPLALLRAGEPSKPEPPDCMIAIFPGESLTMVSCPTGTPLSVVAAIAELFRDSPSAEVNLDITGRSFEFPPKSSRWVLLHMSKAKTRISVSTDVQWDKVPGLIETIASLGYASDACVVRFPELVTMDATNAKILRWIGPGLDLGGG